MTTGAFEGTTFRTAVAVGATGMLSQALDWVAARSERTVLVARRASAWTPETAPGAGLLPLDRDWRNGAELANAVAAAVDPDRVDLVLLWVHDTGTAGLQRLLDLFAPRDLLIVHVLSSAAGDPAAYRDAVARRGTAACYRTVKLGAIQGRAGWRWLSDAEISDGAIRAIRERRDVTVGEIPR
jgi:hypothetical protein